VVVRDLKIDGDRPNAVQQISSIYVYDGAADCLIENVLFKDHGTGVWMAHCDRISVVNCRFEDGVESKCHIVTEGSVPGSGLTNFATTILVTGNYFGECTQEAIDINAKTRGMIIDSNFFFRNYTDSPLVGENNEVIDIGSNSDCFDIVVSNNRVNGDGYAEAFVYVKQGSQRVNIENNIVVNLNTTSTDPGAAFAHIANSKHVNVVGNTVQGACRLAIVHERSSTVTAEYINISNNSISGVTKEGVRLDICTNPTNFVTISGNNIHTSTPASYGIWGLECVNLNINNNIIVGFDTRGIQLVSGVDKFSVVNNQLRNCNIGISTQAAYGVIGSNSVVDSTAEGIISNAVGNVISGNMVTGSGTQGIALNAADKNTVSGNVCTLNGNFGLRVVSVSADVAVVGNMFLGNTSGSIGLAVNLTGASVNANNVV
jgi:parallel beta-helix repeat protein